MNLKGTDKEKAEQLFELLKERSLSLDELKEIVPLTASFMKELSLNISNQIKVDEECYKAEVQVIQDMAFQLTGLLSNEELSEALKFRILDLLKDLNESIRELAKKRQDNSMSFKSIMAFLMTVLAILVIILTATDKSSKSSHNDGSIK